MNEPASETGVVVAKLLAHALDGPKILGQAIALATLTVAQALLSLVSTEMVGDIQCLKDSMLRKTAAEANEAEADSQLRVAEATEAANEVSRAKRREKIDREERLAKIETEKATTAKTGAEAAAICMDAETRRMVAVEEARSRFLEALSKLRQEGGDLLVSEENLRKLLRLPPPETAKE